MSLFSFFKPRHTHRAPEGWCGGTPYGSLAFRGKDGMGIVHMAVVLKCADCGKPFDVARFHTTDATMETHREQIGAVQRCLASKGS